ncbi:hypothetical protein KJ632_05950, partial [Patescibacteria group bacterium]|nr:hypothetical protein [Patescibacteria group bacterium]
MAYHAHADMEVLLGLGSLTATSEPISDAAMDLITGLVEGYADAKIRAATGNTLAEANTASAASTKAALMELSRKYYLAQQTSRAGAASTSTSEGSKSYAGSMRWDPEIGVLIGLASSGGSPYVVK